MILLAFDGLANEDIAEQVGCERHAVGPRRHRRADAFDRLVWIECGEKPSALPRAIEELLSDLPRSGSPGSFAGSAGCPLRRATFDGLWMKHIKCTSA